MADTDRDFYGSGMKFPPRVNPATGRFVTVDGAASVRQSLYLILMTQRGERWLEPGFGSNMMGYTFIDTAPTMLSIMRADLSRTLLEQEPRISGVNVEIEATGDAGVLRINIAYTLAATSQVDNLVFPFYLNAAVREEEDELAEGYADE